MLERIAPPIALLLAVAAACSPGKLSGHPESGPPGDGRPLAEAGSGDGSAADLRAPDGLPPRRDGSPADRATADSATSDARAGDRGAADAAPADSAAQPDVQPIADGPAAGTGYLILPRAALEARPTTGTAWDFLKSKADEAVGTPLSAASASSPWLPNYTVVAPKYLAAALVHASSWPGDKTPYRAAVENALRHVIGSEEQPSSDGTAAGDALLATARQLSAWVMAAELIALDGTRTGSRTGWTSVTFDAWLAQVLTKTIGTHGRWKTIRQTHENSASNWGAHCAASRVAVALHRKDAADLQQAVKVIRGFFGDSAAYPAYPPGATPSPGTGFQVTASFDPSWACPYAASVGGWLPINPASCGDGHDGAVVEDIGRSAGAYPTWDATGIGYAYESIGALHLAALLLAHAGQPAFQWSDDALKRAMLWLERQGQLPSTQNSTTQRHISWVTNHFYGTSLPTQPAAMGRSLGFTDWLFP